MMDGSMNSVAGSEGAFFWVALALINAGLAEQKSRSRLAWFFISLFLGPFATALIVFMRPPAPPPRSHRSGQKNPDR
jgi:hypothetical protein